MATSEGTAGEGFPCTWDGCDYSSHSRRNVSVHHTKAHGEPISGVETQRDVRYKQGAEHACPSCDKSFETRQGLGQHHSAAHGETIQQHEQPDGEHDCPSCSRSFSSLGGMKRHHLYTHGESIAGSEVVCFICGTTKTVEPYETRGQDKHFCGDKCRSEWRSGHWEGENNPNHKGKTTVACDHCGEGTQIFPSEAWKLHHFCNRRCYEQWFSENRSGEDSPHFEGGAFPYGPGWNDRKKESVRKAANYRCEGCGFHDLAHREHYGRALDVHHKIKARVFDGPEERNGEDNLAALCYPCHATAEKMAPLYPFGD